MQIHELNNLSGNLGAGTYLAVDNGRDTGKVSTAQLLAPLGDKASNLETHKVPKPLNINNQPDDGTNGQLLRTKGDGTTEWTDFAAPTSEQVSEAVSVWLDDHPEATTTVLDGSITEPKFAAMPNLDTSNKQLIPAINEINGFAHNKIQIIPIASAATGDATAIIFSDGKTCLIDSNDGDNVVNVVSVLEDNNISHLDYCVLSHYHGDHVNGFLTAALDDYLNNETVFFLPQDVPASLTGLYASMVALKDKLNNLGCQIVQPNTEKQTYTIEDYCYFEFYNVDHDDYYAEAAFDYNNCSLCVKLHYYQNTAFFSGDIGLSAQRFLCGSVGNVSIYKAQHHGSDNFQDAQWLEEVNPDIVYCCASSANESDYLLKRQFVVQMAKMGKSVYSTSNNGSFAIDMSPTESNVIAKSTGVYNQITSLDILLGATTYGQSFPNATMQTLVDAIPFNTEFDFVATIGRVPNLFSSTNITPNSDSTAFEIRGTKFYNGYFIVEVIDIIMGTVYNITVDNGTIVTDRIKTFKSTATTDIDFELTNTLSQTKSLNNIAQKILSVDFVYNTDLYYLINTDNIVPILNIRDTENAIGLLFSSQPSTTRKLKIRVAYVPRKA